jgi:hypothetical protein
MDALLLPPHQVRSVDPKRSTSHINNPLTFSGFLYSMLLILPLLPLKKHLSAFVVAMLSGYYFYSSPVTSFKTWV